MLQINLWWSLAAVLIGAATLLLFLWLLGFDVLSSSAGTGYGLAYRWLETISTCWDFDSNHRSDNDIIGELHARVSALEDSEVALRDTYGSPYRCSNSGWSIQCFKILVDSYKCSVSVHTTWVVRLLRPPRTTWATAPSQKGKSCTKIPQLKTPCCQTDRQSCLD